MVNVNNNNNNNTIMDHIYFCFSMMLFGDQGEDKHCIRSFVGDIIN